MDTDARDGTHPVITPIRDVLEANGAFDAITYLKGAAVIRMLESYLGEDSFRAGVRRYMHEHALGNTVTDDLWKAMDRGSSHPVTEIAHDFTLQAGVPLVSDHGVTCSGGSSAIRLSQGHFAVDADSTSARSWHVPATVRILDGGTAKLVVSGAATTTVTIKGCGPLLLNSGQSGYFRSRYDAASQSALVTRFATLPSEDQFGVLSDTLSLAYAGEEPMAAFLELAQHFPAGADPVVTSALIGRLRGLDRIYQDLPGQAAYRAYARGLLEPILATVTWDRIAGESENAATLRADLIAALNEFDDPAIVAEARRRFERFLAEPSSLDASTRRSVLRAVALQADAQTWEVLHGLARSAATFVERQELYDLLGAARDPALADRALELALSGEPPKTVVPEIINVVSRLHPRRAFEFAVANWDRVELLIEPNIRSRYVPRLISNASDATLIDAVNQFAEQHIPAQARLDLRKAVANVRYFATIRRDRLPEVDEWLRAHPLS
jgi:aminopeptidase N